MSLRKRRIARKMRISDHFIIDEVTCRCGCGQATVDPILLRVVERFRKYLNDEYKTKKMAENGQGYKIKVLSGNRCAGYNGRVGGSPGSYHLYRKRSDEAIHGAMDFTVPGMSNRKLKRIAKKSHKTKEILSGGLGIYPWGIHVDTGPHRKWEEK